MSSREELLEYEIAKFMKEYTRKKGRIDSKDRKFNRKILRRVQTMDPTEWNNYISGQVSEQSLEDAGSKKLDAQVLWLNQRKRIRFSEIQIISIDFSGIEYLDEPGKTNRIDFQECRLNFEKYFDAIVRVVENSKIFPMHRRYVGFDRSRTRPPYIEFFTSQPTRFEFADNAKGQFDLRDLRSRIVDIGFGIA